MIRKSCRLFKCFVFSLCLATLGSMMASAQSLTILHSFGDNSVIGDGNSPTDALVEGNDGNFYGTTSYGGSTAMSGNQSSGSGTVFRVTPAGAVAILHSFRDGSVPNDGIKPEAGLVEGSDGNFYGATQYGGGFGGSEGSGTIFKVTKTGAFTILHRFGDGSVGNDGFSPNGLVLGTDGNFYGTTGELGSGGGGTVFKMTPAGALTVLHNFQDGSVTNDGAVPSAALTQSSDGNFYGTTVAGGSKNSGTVFKITPSGVETILHSFQDGTVMNDGFDPFAGLTAGSDGNFYGTTTYGGSTINADPYHEGKGTVFKITSTGTVTILHSFQDGSVSNDGYGPNGLVLSSDGYFYGTTGGGGFGGGGTIFRATATGTVTILHGFRDGSVTNDGSGPDAALLIGRDGNFYGTTLFGGSAGSGIAFRFSLSGSSSVPVWTAYDTAAAPDGTARILWTRSDGAAGIWAMSAGDTQIAVGPTYGPYPGWSAKALSVAGDGTARVLWTNTSGAAGVWAFDANGNETVIGPSYGPYPGWTAADIAATPGGYSHLLWTRSDGAAGVWTLTTAGAETLIGPTFGPFTGWTAKAVGTAGDASSRLLWTRSDGAAGLWSLTPSDTQQTVGPAYGPYSDSMGAWSAADLGTSADGTSNVLWARTDEAIGIWTFNTAGVETSIGPIVGPYPGWLAKALDSANNQSRVLWSNSDRAAGLWSFVANDAESVIGSVYGPY